MSLPFKMSEYRIHCLNPTVEWDSPIPLSQDVSSLQQLIFLRVVNSNFAGQICLSPGCLVAEITSADCCNVMGTPCKHRQFSQSNHHCNWAPLTHARTLRIQ